MHQGSTQKVSGNGINRKTRVTLVIPDVLDRNIEAYSLREGLLKNQVVAAALEKYLREKGLQPDKPPKVSLSY
jgi:hypothetical protein